MSKPLAFGLNLAKKPGQAKPPPKRKPMFGGDDSDSDDAGHKGSNKNGASAVLEIGSLDDFGTSTQTHEQDNSRKSRPKPSKGAPPPKLKPKTQPTAMFGDLSSSLAARKNAEAAEELDPSVYEYDAVYDKLKPEKKAPDAGGAERRSRYMKDVIQSAEVRKRDQLIANEKKIAREREAEGEEFEGKEKFVTEAYKRQQEENRRTEEEEKRREEEEARKNKDGGMSSFYRKMLNRDEERHSQAVKAAEEAAKEGSKKGEDAGEDLTEEQLEAKRVKELNEKGASIAVNEDGQVVDKRQLLKGGLNVSAKASAAPTQRDNAQKADQGNRRPMSGSQIGNKQAMRERQSRMLAEQLEQASKRSREVAESQRDESERAAKSRKTEGEISSAKERYLARKRAAEEEKKKAAEA
jgi:coiled-coil domain-containing protein 55